MSGKLETLCLASELLPCLLCQVTVDLCVSEAIKCFSFPISTRWMKAIFKLLHSDLLLPHFGVLFVSMITDETTM